MEFADFEERAHFVFEKIPASYREGIDGLRVSRETLDHPELAGVYTLGECLTEEHVSDFGGPETTRSTLVVYWGSFRAVSTQRSGFDWDEEVWETLTHELRHHLESLAGDSALEASDYAEDENFKRRQGRAFDPFYYESGEAFLDGVYRVDGDWYVEQVWSADDFGRASALPFSWAGRDYRVDRPVELADVHYVALHGLMSLPEERVEIVLVRKPSWWEEVKRAVGTSRPVVLESDAEAAPAEPLG